MNLYLTSAYEVHPGLDVLLEAAQSDLRKQHSLCASASEADAIVFIENTQFDDILFSTLLQHDLLLEFSDKCFMYNEMDRPWDVLPGLYACMAKSHIQHNRHRAFAYLSTPNQLIRNVFHESYERKWLFSFMGAMSHHCRRSIMKLQHDGAYLKDTSNFNVWNTGEEEMQQRARHYAQVLGESQFVLCPRGIGSSSIRLYETLEAGRVPVVIADSWVPPSETDWSFAVQVQERRIAGIPALLESMADESIDRGQAAREAWLASYAPGTLFNTLGNSIESLVLAGNGKLQKKSPMQWNKWVASSGLITRTAVQRLRGQR